MDVSGGRYRRRDPAVTARRRALLAYVQAKQRVLTAAGRPPAASAAESAARAARRFTRAR
jgi:hypothetical protein